jgi:hypothetical protein
MNIELARLAQHTSRLRLKAFDRVQALFFALFGNKFYTKLAAQPPCNATIFSYWLIPIDHEAECIRHREVLAQQPGAAIGNVDDDAIGRWRTAFRQELRDAIDGRPLIVASFAEHGPSFGGVATLLQISFNARQNGCFNFSENVAGSCCSNRTLGRATFINAG